MTTTTRVRSLLKEIDLDRGQLFSGWPGCKIIGAADDINGCEMAYAWYRFNE